jgi:hypothetical protein
MLNVLHNFSTVFGWKIEPWGPPEYGYMHVHTANLESGELMEVFGKLKDLLHLRVEAKCI